MPFQKGRKPGERPSERFGALTPERIHEVVGKTWQTREKEHGFATALHRQGMVKHAIVQLARLKAEEAREKGYSLKSVFVDGVGSMPIIDENDLRRAGLHSLKVKYGSVGRLLEESGFVTERRLAKVPHEKISAVLDSLEKAKDVSYSQALQALSEEHGLSYKTLHALLNPNYERFGGNDNALQERIHTLRGRFGLPRAGLPRQEASPSPVARFIETLPDRHQPVVEEVLRQLRAGEQSVDVSALKDVLWERNKEKVTANYIQELKQQGVLESAGTGKLAPAGQLKRLLAIEKPPLAEALDGVIAKLSTVLAESELSKPAEPHEFTVSSEVRDYLQRRWAGEEMKWRAIWDKPENRVGALVLLAQRLNKRIPDLTIIDLNSNALSSIYTAWWGNREKMLEEVKKVAGKDAADVFVPEGEPREAPPKPKVPLPEPPAAAAEPMAQDEAIKQAVFDFIGSYPQGRTLNNFLKLAACLERHKPGEPLMPFTIAAEAGLTEAQIGRLWWSFSKRGISLQDAAGKKIVEVQSGSILSESLAEPKEEASLPEAPEAFRFEPTKPEEKAIAFMEYGRIHGIKYILEKAKALFPGLRMGKLRKALEKEAGRGQLALVVQTGRDEFTLTERGRNRGQLVILPAPRIGAALKEAIKRAPEKEAPTTEEEAPKPEEIEPPLPAELQPLVDAYFRITGESDTQGLRFARLIKLGDWEVARLELIGEGDGEPRQRDITRMARNIRGWLTGKQRKYPGLAKLAQGDFKAAEEAVEAPSAKMGRRGIWTKENTIEALHNAYKEHGTTNYTVLNQKDPNLTRTFIRRRKEWGFKKWEDFVEAAGLKYEGVQRGVAVDNIAKFFPTKILSGRSGKPSATPAPTKERALRALETPPFPYLRAGMLGLIMREDGSFRDHLFQPAEELAVSRGMRPDPLVAGLTPALRARLEIVLGPAIAESIYDLFAAGRVISASQLLRRELGRFSGKEQGEMGALVDRLSLLDKPLANMVLFFKYRRYAPKEYRIQSKGKALFHELHGRLLRAGFGEEDALFLAEKTVKDTLSKFYVSADDVAELEEEAAGEKEETRLDEELAALRAEAKRMRRAIPATAEGEKPTSRAEELLSLAEDGTERQELALAAAKRYGVEPDVYGNSFDTLVRQGLLRKAGHQYYLTEEGKKRKAELSGS